jgi:hypothetical protein
MTTNPKQDPTRDEGRSRRGYQGKLCLMFR